MREIHYSEFSGEKPVLRDYLAIDRTVLANERTVLAYLRTALAFAVVGASAIKFFDSLLYETLGAAFIVFGAVVGILGARRSSACRSASARRWRSARSRPSTSRGVNRRRGLSRRSSRRSSRAPCSGRRS